LTENKSPDPTGIYFATFDSLPPVTFGTPKSIEEFLAQANQAQGLPDLTETEINQINALAVITFKVCESALTRKSKSRGCLFLLVFFMVGTGTLGSLVLGLSR
jgi:hypothetical protein